MPGPPRTPSAETLSRVSRENAVTFQAQPDLTEKLSLPVAQALNPIRKSGFKVLTSSTHDHLATKTKTSNDLLS
ncbi:unnamed protein product [Rhodiola kirilowii]